MKRGVEVNINQISPEGLTLEEDIIASSLDLETDIVKFRRPIQIKAIFSKITNAVTVDVALTSSISTICSRCLNELEIDLKKKLRLSYAVDKSEQVVNLGPDIREEIILDYPLKPLCNPDCKGLCPRCGKNLNEGGCSCAIT